MAENFLSDFGWNAKTEERSRKPASEAVPAVPAVADDRLDFTTAEVV